MAATLTTATRRSAEPADTVAGRARLDLSVVVPLVDDHGMAEECLDSWLRQTHPRDRLQLVVVDHGVAPRRARRLRARLQEHDLWLPVPSVEESVLYDRGARAAGAATVLFTEAHCLAEPAAARRILDLLADETLDAAVVASSHIERSALARMQGELEREWHERWPAGHWRTLSLRGFAIRRDSYVAAGGFQQAHGRFCETAMGIALARAGRRIGRTAEPLIRHGNCESIRDLAGALASCARGQLAWRRTAEAEEPGLAERWLADGGAWNRREGLSRAAGRSLAGALARSLLTPRLRSGGAAMSRREELALLPRWTAVAFLGGQTARAAARIAFARAALGWWWARATGAPLLSPHRALWSAAFELGFSDAIAAHPATPVWPALTGDGLSIDAFPAGAAAGFHAPERQAPGGPVIRWTGPAALLRLGLPPGDHRLRLEVRWPVTAGDRVCSAFLNGRRLDDLRWDDGTLELGLPRRLCRPSGRQDLVLVTRALPAGHGAAPSRLLGLGIFGARRVE